MVGLDTYTSSQLAQNPFTSCPWDVLFTILCHVQVLDIIALRGVSGATDKIPKSPDLRKPL